VASPLGPVTLHETGGVLVRLTWGERAADRSPLMDLAAAQLDDWFAGRRGGFDLPLDWGSGLHAQVRRAMADIPRGETRTYGAIARAIGAPAQAVGQACGANPLPLLIRCHRVTGTNWLGGFSAPGGVETKASLLQMEGALLI